MKTTKKFIVLFAGAALFLAGCAPKDADIQKAVKEKEAENITVAVDKGVVTLGGEVMEPTEKTNAENLAKEVKGVKSVVNNITEAAPITIADDTVLSKNVTDAVKDFSTVKADVKDGVVMLTGEIKKADLVTLMQRIASLNPKKIDNKITVK